MEPANCDTKLEFCMDTVVFGGHVGFEKSLGAIFSNSPLPIYGHAPLWAPGK